MGSVSTLHFWETELYNQYTLFDSSRFSHSDCWSSPVMYANKRTLLEDKEWHTVGSSQQPSDYSPNAFPTELRRKICGVGFLLILHSAIVSANVTYHCVMHA